VDAEQNEPGRLIARPSGSSDPGDGFRDLLGPDCAEWLSDPFGAGNNYDCPGIAPLDLPNREAWCDKEVGTRPTAEEDVD
jgi:hypothetical protein